MSSEERMDKMENQLIDMRLAVSGLLETTAVHQRNFDTLVYACGYGANAIGN
jgi:hypothetical protein